MTKKQNENEFGFVVGKDTQVTVTLTTDPACYYVYLNYGKWPHRDDIINLCATLNPNMIGEDRVCDAEVSTELWEPDCGVPSKIVILQKED